MSSSVLFQQLFEIQTVALVVQSVHNTTPTPPANMMKKFLLYLTVRNISIYRSLFKIKNVFPFQVLVIAGFSVAADFSCTKVGTFLNSEDVSCQKYYVCSVLSDGTYITTAATCSSLKKFDPQLNACSDSYVCDFNATTTTTEGTTVADFQCTAAGRFENPNDFSCTTYYLCSKYRGEFLKTLYTCPVSTSFDPELRRCTTQHVCASTTTTMVATTIMDFQCTATGRFENSNDLSCTTYYLCSKYYGTFIKTLYKCPLSTYFDPVLHRCTTQHVCATATTTTTTTNVPETTTEAEMVSWLNVTSSTTETAYDDFVCTTRGRYANFYDNSCKRYYLCNQLQNGTLLRTAYSCPSNSVFDQSIYKCTTVQDCSSIRNSAFVVTPQFDN